MEKDCGKWQVAFWIISAGFIFLTGSVIANEVRNVDAHERITSGISANIDKLRVEIKQDIKDMKVEILHAIKE